MPFAAATRAVNYSDLIRKLIKKDHWKKSSQLTQEIVGDTILSLTGGSSLEEWNSSAVLSKLFRGKKIFLKQLKTRGGKEKYDAKLDNGSLGSFDVECKFPESKLVSLEKQVKGLQDKLYEKEHEVSALKRKMSKQATPGTSERSKQRKKRKLLSEMEKLTGKKMAVVEKLSPRKMSRKLDQHFISQRKYQALKGKHQPPLRKVRKVRKKANEKASDVNEIFMKFVESKSQATGPAKFKISGDGHNLGKFRSGCTFSLTFIDGTQKNENIVPLLGIQGAENYQLHKECGFWEALPPLLQHKFDFEVEHYLCMDYKTLLIVMGYKAANGRQTCIYCKCDKSKWHLCQIDSSSVCVPRWKKEDGSYVLPMLGANDPGSKGGACKPLIDTSLFKFVLIDTLHCFLRVTDQLFNRTVDLFSDAEQGIFVQACHAEGVTGFNFKCNDAQGSKFTKLTMAMRETLLVNLFTAEKLSELCTTLSNRKVSKISAAFSAWRTLWDCMKTAGRADSLQLQQLVANFIHCFRMAFGVLEIANYCHLLTHVPWLYKNFGNVHSFQQQSVEYLNHRMNVAIANVTTPKNAWDQGVKCINRKHFDDGSQT